MYPFSIHCFTGPAPPPYRLLPEGRLMCTNVMHLRPCTTSSDVAGKMPYTTIVRSNRNRHRLHKLETPSQYLSIRLHACSGKEGLHLCHHRPEPNQTVGWTGDTAVRLILPSEGESGGTTTAGLYLQIATLRVSITRYWQRRAESTIIVIFPTQGYRRHRRRTPPVHVESSS